MQLDLNDANFAQPPVCATTSLASGESRVIAGKVVMRVVIIWLSITLCGCSNLQPRPPATLMKPFEVQFKENLGDDASKASVPQIRQGIAAFNNELLTQLNNQNNVAWNYSDITFFGVIGTVAGVAADKVGLRNTGAGAATLGTTFPGHYQVEPTFQAYLKAMKRASCTESRVASLPNDLEALLNALDTSSDDADALQAVLAAHQNLQSDVYGALNTIRTDLATSILTSRPTDASVSDISGTLAKFKNASLKPSEVSAANSTGDKMVKQLRLDASLKLTDAKRDVRLEQDKLSTFESTRKSLETDSANARQILALKQQAFDAMPKITITAENPSPNPPKEQLDLKKAQGAAEKVNADLTLARSREMGQRQILSEAFTRLRIAEKIDSAAKATSVEEKARDLKAAIEQLKGLAGALELCTKL